MATLQRTGRVRGRVAIVQGPHPLAPGDNIEIGAGGRVGPGRLLSIEAMQLRCPDID